MATDREEALRATISRQKWNTTAWDGLIAVVASTGNVDKQRETYEEILSQFPYAVRFCMSQLSLTVTSQPDLQINSPALAAYMRSVIRLRAPLDLHAPVYGQSFVFLEIWRSGDKSLSKWCFSGCAAILARNAHEYACMMPVSHN